MSCDNSKNVSTLHELEKQLPFRSGEDGRDFARTPAHSYNGGAAAGRLTGRLFLKYVREYSKLGYGGRLAHLSRFAEGTVFGKQLVGPPGGFSHAFFSELELYISYAVLRFGEELDGESFESLRQKIEDRLAVTEAESAREFRSASAKEARARRKSGGESSKRALSKGRRRPFLAIRGVQS
jgi:hypothetical protein